MPRLLPRAAAPAVCAAASRPQGLRARLRAARAARTPRPYRPGRALRSDRGQVALEFLGWLPLLLLVALICIQVGLIGYAAQQAGTAARTAARMDSLHGEGGAAAGRAAVSGWLNPSLSGGPAGDRVTYTATVRVPSLLPGLLDIDDATRTATMPYDGGRP
ncbi:TadE/TadG family type IV pilus assembly protein [Streptomyces sp. NPDC097619]|uniref:TadE/TadG family type IV pilus assembly protein n=1 Tax=Streptomyces sp. NPDC097619 TaxID=3157228 RepID=UPI003324BF1E